MAQPGLKPLYQTQEGQASYLSYNFNALAQAVAFAAVGVRESVTGSKVIDTGITHVGSAIAILTEAPAANGVHVAVFTTANPSEIEIRVYDSSFVLSTVAKNVSWIAIPIA